MLERDPLLELYIKWLWLDFLFTIKEREKYEKKQDCLYHHSHHRQQRAVAPDDAQVPTAYRPDGRQEAGGSYPGGQRFYFAGLLQDRHLH